MRGLPTDPEIQRMSNADLAKLWDKRPTYTTNIDWIRVAKEIRYRNRHQPGSIECKANKYSTVSLSLHVRFDR